MMKRFFRLAKANRFSSRALKLARSVGEAVKKHPTATAALAVSAAAATLGAGNVLAWTAPAAGSFAYDVYDIAVNQILNGPIGFVTGMGVMGAGGYFIANSRAGGMAAGIPMILLGGSLIKLDTITSSLGYMF